jgi:hypothetical protein
VDKTIKETTKKCLELSFMEARFLCPRDWDCPRNLTCKESLAKSFAVLAFMSFFHSCFEVVHQRSLGNSVNPTSEEPLFVANHITPFPWNSWSHVVQSKRLRPLHTWDWEPMTITLQALSLVEKVEPVQLPFTLRLRYQQSMWI